MVAPQYITLGVCTAVPVTHWEITLLLWWKWLPCRKRSKLLICGWSLAGVWLFGKWALLGYMAWKTIWHPQQLVKIICFVIEAEGLFWGTAIEEVICTDQRPQSYRCPLIKKVASEDTGLCSVISCSLFIPFRSWAVTGLLSNALGCLTAAVLREVETVLTA